MVESIASYNSLVPDTVAVDTADAILSQEFPIWPWDSGICIFIHVKRISVCICFTQCPFCILSIPQE